MNVHAHRQLPPSSSDAALARASRQLLAALEKPGAPLSLRVVDDTQEAPIELPAGAVALLIEILDAMAAGRGVTIIPENAELTTAEAAEVLNVSRPFLIGLLEQGQIKFRKVGSHRRIRMEDVMDYKEKVDTERDGILAELVADAEDQDMGYSRL